MPNPNDGQHYFLFRRVERIMTCEGCLARMNSRAAEVKPCPKRVLDPDEVEARLSVPTWAEKKGKGVKA